MKEYETRPELKSHGPQFVEIIIDFLSKGRNQTSTLFNMIMQESVLRDSISNGLVNESYLCEFADLEEKTKVLRKQFSEDSDRCSIDGRCGSIFIDELTETAKIRADYDKLVSKLRSGL